MSEPLKIFKQLDGIKSVLEKRKAILSEKISREERMPAGETRHAGEWVPLLLECAPAEAD